MHQKHKNSLLLVDKPAGMSSFEVIRKLRRITGIKKMGHSGTLDPFASGLLLIATGDKTKELQSFIKLPKKYKTTMFFGRKTDTLDTDGQIIEEIAPLDLIDIKNKVLKILPKIVGKMELPVPLFSAIHVNGKRLYQYAREGKQPPFIPTKTMVVNDYKIDSWQQENDFVKLLITLEVESGTYIRSITKYIGDLINTPSMVSDLRRISIGPYKIENAMTIEEFMVYYNS